MNHIVGQNFWWEQVVNVKIYDEGNEESINESPLKRIENYSGKITVNDGKSEVEK